MTEFHAGRYYYQFNKHRLLACTLAIHGFLHLAEGIRHCGPIWTTWTFFIEQFCGKLQRTLHSQV